MSNSMMIRGEKNGKVVKRTVRCIGYNFQERVDAWVKKGYSDVRGYPSNESTGKPFPTINGTKG